MASLLASLDSLEKAPRKSSKKEGRKEKSSKKEKLAVAEGGSGRYAFKYFKDLIYYRLFYKQACNYSSILLIIFLQNF